MTNISLPSLTQDPATWKGSSLLSVQQITEDGLRLLFSETQRMRTLVRSDGGDVSLKNIILATVYVCSYWCCCWHDNDPLSRVIATEVAMFLG